MLPTPIIARARRPRRRRVEFTTPIPSPLLRRRERRPRMRGNTPPPRQFSPIRLRRRSLSLPARPLPRLSVPAATAAAATAAAATAAATLRPPGKRRQELLGAILQMHPEDPRATQMSEALQPMWATATWATRERLWFRLREYCQAKGITANPANAVLFLETLPLATSTRMGYAGALR